jgi:aspartyl-tRNA(Asn)/glutamyl-tRNA(Gln) amidotransferase subunit B
MAEYESVIGLECHVELSTRTKMFCGCRNAFGAEPNTNVCPVCLGLPGSLPVPNRTAIEYILRIGLALGCRIADRSLFHRKNYFYPDMPKDFQISQYDVPVCVAGHLTLEVDGAERDIGITRVHMEEDTGKTTHAGSTGRIGQADYALVDYNRAGVPLVEVVSDPDIRTPDEARAYLIELRAILETLGVSDVRMEEGSLRCDANISTRRVGDASFGTKVEIKNLNSIRSLERALRYEQERQRGALERGETLVQETRHFDEERGTTHTLRSKEEAFDYRYFPEPDIPPLEPDPAWVEEIRASLPPLPAQRRRELVAVQRLPAEQARLIAATPVLATAFDRVLEVSGVDARTVANWVVNHPGGPEEAGREWRAIADVVRLVDGSEISALAGKDVLEAAIASDRPAAEIVEERGLRQVSDTSRLEAWVDEALAENPDQVEQYRAGKQGLLGFFVGQVMKRSGGSANPKVVNDLLRSRLSGP